MSLLAALLAAALSVPAAAEEEWSPRLGAVSGDVLVYAKDSEEGLPAEEGTPLEDGDRVETGEDGRAELALEPDSVVELAPKASLTVESAKEEDSWFSLELGSLVAKLKSFADRRRRRYSFRTPTAVAAVRGTEFGLDVSEDGETAVGVFDEGQVAVTPEDGEETLLTESNEVVVAPGARELRVRRLERLAARRDRLAHIRGRAPELRRAWRPIPPQRRQELRRQWRQNMRERMRNMPPERRERLQRGFQQRRERLQERRGAMRERRQERREDMRERRQDRREDRREERQDRREDRRQRRGEGPDDDRRRFGGGPGGPGGPGGRPGGPGGPGMGGPNRREAPGGRRGGPGRRQ